MEGGGDLVGSLSGRGRQMAKNTEAALGESRLIIHKKHVVIEDQAELNREHLILCLFLKFQDKT